MNFKNQTFSRVIKILLFPLGCLYGLAIYLRNFLFDRGWLVSRKFPVPIICVGNLSVGGTGKTPMVLYLIELLKNNHQVATLSRGYKRETKGFLVADNDRNNDPATLGDEPFLFHQRFEDALVSVGEDRTRAIEELLKTRSNDLDVLILDDGFQHRKVSAGFNILLTDYQHLFTRDFFLPAGSLRDSRQSARRADVIVVTKCPGNLSSEDKIKITAELQEYGPKSVFFSYIQYDRPISLFSQYPLQLVSGMRILLIQGIASPASLRNYVGQFDPDFVELDFPDHHNFSGRDIQVITEKFLTLPKDNRILLTTEKDGVKLKNFKFELTNLPLYILPIQNSFLFDQKADFDEAINHYLKTVK